jgi:hypothetical protein
MCDIKVGTVLFVQKEREREKEKTGEEVNK